MLLTVSLKNENNVLKKVVSKSLERSAQEPFRHTFTFNPLDLVSNSPYSLSYNSYEVGSKNLVLDQLIP